MPVGERAPRQLAGRREEHIPLRGRGRPLPVVNRGATFIALAPGKKQLHFPYLYRSQQPDPQHLGEMHLQVNNNKK